jgi:DnaJ family protein C protein 2
MDGNPINRLSVVVDNVAEVKRARTKEQELADERRHEARRRHKDEQQRQEKLRQQQASAASWTKQEMSALAKGVKKYPAGGANRWEAITLFVNNLCKPKNPRTKEECIEKYNQLAQKQQSGTSTTTTTTSSTNGMTTNKPNSSTVVVAAAAAGDDDDWTDQQVKELQAGLAKYPATMDKNERWSAIAKCVQGKSKKECVAKFKAIREALKSNTKT